MVSLVGTDRPPEGPIHARHALQILLDFPFPHVVVPCCMHFLENAFACGGFGPIGMFRGGPLYDWIGSGHPDHPDSSFLRLTQVAPSPNVGLGRGSGNVSEQRDLEAPSAGTHRL